MYSVKYFISKLLTSYMASYSYRVYLFRNMKARLKWCYNDQIKITSLSLLKIQMLVLYANYSFIVQ